MQWRGDDHLGSFSNSKREHWILFEVLAFTGKDQYAGGSNRVSEDKKENRRGGRLFSGTQ